MPVPNYISATEEAKSHLPVGNFNNQVCFMHDAAYRAQLAKQQAELDELIDVHFSENMTRPQFVAAITAAKDFEFRAGQSRKSNAGAAYQYILGYLLERQGLTVATRKGTTVDNFVLAHDGTEVAALSFKRTLRERWSQEIKYSPIVKSMGIPHFLVTHDLAVTQPAIDEVLAKGFVVVMRDELVGHYKASPGILSLSQLPARLHMLTRQWVRMAA
jgi:hypothetical protein